VNESVLMTQHLQLQVVLAMLYFPEALH